LCRCTSHKDHYIWIWFAARRTSCAWRSRRPIGWEARLIRVDGYANVFALNHYDLALVKLVVGREKDLNLLRSMLQLKIVEAGQLRRHYQENPMSERETFIAGKNLQAVLTAS